MMNLFSRKLTPQPIKITPVGGVGIGASNNVRDLQKFNASFPAWRPESLVGYTGGWTLGYGNPTMLPQHINIFGVKG